jgi:hypothetical protein
LSEHDFSGIDERHGRWIGPLAETLFVLGSLLALALIAFFIGRLLDAE